MLIIFFSIFTVHLIDEYDEKKNYFHVRKFKNIQFKFKCCFYSPPILLFYFFFYIFMKYFFSVNNTTDCLSLSADSSMLSTMTTSKSLLKSCDESGLECDHHGTVMSNSNPIATTSSSSIQTASSSKKTTTGQQHYHTLHHTNPTTGSGNSSSTKTGSTSSSSTSAGGLTATSSLKKHLNILRGSGAKKTESVSSSSSSSAGSKPTTATPANPTPQTSVIGSFITSTSSSITANGNLMPPPTNTPHSPVSSMNSNSSLNSKLVEYEGKINDLNIELSKYQHNRSVLK